MKNKTREIAYVLYHNLKYICLFSLLFFTYCALLPSRWVAFWDMMDWANWSVYMFKYGLQHVYNSSSDYVPLYQYILFLFGKIQGSIDAIDHNIHYLKLFTLVFDFIAGFYLIRYLQTKLHDINLGIILSLFFFLNIAYLYNTLIWGQVDSINACFIFLAFFFALKQRVLTTLIFVLLALNLKVLSIIFLPIIGLMLLPAIISQFSFSKLLTWILIPVLIQFLIILPFLLAGDLDKLFFVIKNSASKYPGISLNAFNLWHWLIKGDLAKMPDYYRLWGIPGLTCKHVGYALFLGSGFMALFPLLKNTWNNILHKQQQPIAQEKLLIMAALAPLLFFFLCTEMHERYTHTAFLFLAAYSLSTGKYFPYITGSIAYFLNLEKVVEYWPLNHNTFIFAPGFVAFLYFLCIGYLFLQLYGVRLITNNR
jgi:Gpi18-like mannosyltransferase